MRIIATLATNHKIDKRKERLQTSGRKRNTFICVAPSCQASFRSRTLLGDDRSLLSPVLSTLGRTNLGRRVGFRDSGFPLSEACTPSSERSRGFAEDPGVCVCVCVSLSLSLSVHVLWRSTLFYVDGFNAFVPAWALSFRLFRSQSWLRVLIKMLLEDWFWQSARV